jgi:hypothetical protein
VLEGQIIQDIKGFMGQWGGGYAAWYVGIAEDARNRLFVEHGVNEQTDPWIHHLADSASAARRVEQYFLMLGTGGGPGGGSEATMRVYAYKKSPHTTP